MERRRQSRNLSCEQDMLSLENNDSNALILQSKKKNKGSQEIKANPAPKLSKSEKKKMKKLEEEKEKALLLTKSLEILQKYTIPDGAYSLLKSTRNIGQLKVDPKCSRCGGGFKEDIILAIWKCSSIKIQ